MDVLLIAFVVITITVVVGSSESDEVVTIVLRALAASHDHCFQPIVSVAMLLSLDEIAKSSLAAMVIRCRRHFVIDPAHRLCKITALSRRFSKHPGAIQAEADPWAVEINYSAFRCQII